MSDINNVTETSATNVATNSVEIVTESSSTNQIKQVKFSDHIHKKYFISNGSNSNEHTPLLNLAPKASSLKVTSNLKVCLINMNSY